MALIFSMFFSNTLFAANDQEKDISLLEELLLSGYIQQPLKELGQQAKISLSKDQLRVTPLHFHRWLAQNRADNKDQLPEILTEDQKTVEPSPNLLPKTVLDVLTIHGKSLYNEAYHTPDTSTATMTQTPMMDLPLSVTTIPQQVLKDQQAVRLDKVLQNVSGANFDNFNAGLTDSFILRGFESVPFRDGFRFEDQNSNGSRDLANIERVEVLKGPASILYGQIEPGGLVNMITKKPLLRSYQKGEQQFGSYDFYRSTIDTTGPMGSDFSYRFNFAYENAGSFRQFINGERFFIAPVIRWDISPDFQMNFELDYLHGRNTPDNGIPGFQGRPLNVPREKFFGEPFNQAEYNDFVVGLNGFYSFNDQWQLKFRFNAELVQSKITNVTTPFSNPQYSADGQTVSRVLEILDDAHNQSYYNVINLTGKFSTWNFQHSILLGADYYREDTQWGYTDSIEFEPFQINDHRYQSIQPLIDPSRNLPGDDIDETEDWFGIFFQDQVKLPFNFNLLVGFRYDNIGSEGIEFGEAFREPRDDMLTPRVGLIWKPIPALALYSSYIEGLSGTNGLSLEGGQLTPETAQQLEVGVKTELLQGRFISSIAYYEIKKQNVAVPDPLNTNFSRAIGELEVKGVEWQFSGQLTDNWNIFGAYAYTPFAKILKDQTPILAEDDETVLGLGLGNTGRRFGDVPQHNASLWTTYSFWGGLLDGFKLGAGVLAVSERYADLANTTKASGYVLTNIMLGYQFQYGSSMVNLQLNIDNLFDKQYFSSSSGLRFSPGAPRSFIASVKLEF